MVNFDIKLSCIELLRESTCPIMLKFGLEIALGMIQKSDAGIFEILIFRDFSGGQIPKFSKKYQNLKFDPLKIVKNGHIQRCHSYDITIENLKS